jgi:queuine tRNA-ribosyltransferase
MMTDAPDPDADPAAEARTSRNRGRKRAGRGHPINVNLADMPVPEYANFGFERLYQDPVSAARLGRITTPHGTVDTPNFIFCGTKATVKGVTVPQLREHGTSIILSNTYHLMLQPGADLVARMGGLHKFCGWNGPMLTDSGGYQIFAMGHGSVAEEIKGNRKQNLPRTLLKVTEEAAHFRAYTDGRTVVLRPEDAIDTQRKLGADLIVQLDECTAYHDGRDYTARSMQLSQRWGDRSLAEFIRGDDGKQALYGVIQGGVFDDLRVESAQYVSDRPFFGIAVGGCLGASKDEMYRVVNWTMQYVRRDRPVHLLGIGGIADIFNGVRQGIDTFDCVSPTRIARHGWAIMAGQPGQRLNLRNGRFRDDEAPLDETSPYWASHSFSRAYVHHLFKAGEFLGMQILSMHNIAQMNRLLADIRQGIATGTLDAVERHWLGEV